MLAPACLERLIITSITLLFLATGYLLYGSTGHDDSHITFWASYSLLEQGAILNYNGEPIAQSSSLLLTVLIAVLAHITALDVVTAGYLLVIASAGLCLPYVAALANTGNNKAGIPALLLLGTSPSFMLWAFSGMEATLAALCLLAWITSMVHCLTAGQQQVSRFIGLATTTLLLAAVRPEMPLVIAAAVGTLVIVMPATSRARTGFAGAVAGSVIVLYMLLYHRYFNAWFPQPVSVKTALASPQKILEGLYYLLTTSLLNPATLLLAAVPVIAGQAMLRKTLSPYILPALLVIAIYLGFIVTSGGDWMQAGRFLVPILPLYCMTGGTLAAILLANWKKTSWFLIAGLIGVNIYMHTLAIATLSHGMPVWAQYRITDIHQARYNIFEQMNQEHLRDMDVIDHLDTLITTLHNNTGRRINVLSGQGGMVFFYTAKNLGHKIRFTDLRGLVENSLPGCPVLGDIARGKQGLAMDYATFFERLPGLQQACGIAAPDIVYDINNVFVPLQDVLPRYGYELVHMERGSIIENPGPIPVFALLSPNLVYIRKELLAPAGVAGLVTIDYRQKPLRDRLILH